MTGGRRRDDVLPAAREFVREVVGSIAFALAACPEGRAAGLGVEVWPDRGVGLRVLAGHELRIFIESGDDAVWIVWERSDPGPDGRRWTSRGRFGPYPRVEARGLRVFMTRWLAWRAHG